MEEYVVDALGVDGMEQKLAVGLVYTYLPLSDTADNPQTDSHLFLLFGIPETKIRHIATSLCYR